MKNKKKKILWFSIALPIVIIFITGVFFIINNYQTVSEKDVSSTIETQIAYKETKKALSLLSLHLNIGMKSVVYVQEYENTKNKVFKR